MGITKIKNTWDNHQIDFVQCQDTQNLSGGLLVLWNKDVLRVSNFYKGQRWVILEGCIAQEDWCYSVGLIYGSCDSQESQNMYIEITTAIQKLVHPLLLLGDYNEIVSLGKRRGKTRVTQSMSLNAWSSDKSFKTMVFEEWSKLGGLSADQKLKLIKEPIKLWNMKTFGLVD